MSCSACATSSRATSHRSTPGWTTNLYFERLADLFQILQQQTAQLNGAVRSGDALRAEIFGRNSISLNMTQVHILIEQMQPYREQLTSQAAQIAEVRRA
jgi:hypothetical protein